MKLNADDPRLTAYALGELDPAERAAIETELQNNPECRQVVEEIRGAANTLSSELSAEPCPALRPEQRESIAGKLQPENVIALPRRSWFATAGIAAIAASILAMVTWQMWFPTTSQRPSNMAKLTQPATATTPVVLPEIATQTANPTTVVSAPPAEPSGGPAPTVVPPVVLAAPIAQNLNAGQATPPQDAEVIKRNLDSKGNAVSGWVNGNYTTSYSISTTQTQPVYALGSTDGTTAPPTVYPLGTSLKEVEQRSQAQSQQVATVGGAPATLHNFTSGLADNTAQPTPALRAGGRGGRGGRMGGGGGGGIAGGGPNSQFAFNNSVVVTEYRRTVQYDPLRDDFAEWRYYRVPPTPRPPPADTANYERYADNEFLPVLNYPLSTFSVDVDTASYSNVRRFLNSNRMPPREAVRIEEMINYFTYHYAQPKGEDPFAASIEVAGCPWDTDHRLVRIGIKGREIPREKRPPSNLVFLIDISGSMQPAERLPLIKQGLRQMVKQMGEGDRVAIVVYASEVGVRLASTPCTDKEKILEAIDSLTAGGSTNGGEGIQEAYRVAHENFIKGGVNRIILCTDGDFNVGMTDQNQLVRMIEDKAKEGVALTTLGVGTDNYKDALMQKLADHGNGNYHYLDSLEEAQKVLVSQVNGTLVTIAKDVKLQIEFNPEKVRSYRLIGYEKRVLRNEDFNNDAKDAGEIGAGHTVTALYEIVPAGRDVPPTVDELKYQQTTGAKSDKPISTTGSKELLTLKLRYKHPEGDKSRLLEFPVTDGDASYTKASTDFKFAAAVASFGMILRDSAHKGTSSYASVQELAGESKGDDESGYRSEFLTLVKKAQGLKRSFE